MSDIVERLRSGYFCETQKTEGGELVTAPSPAVKYAADTIEALRAENAELIQAMHDIYEVYAGSEGFIPETCPEAYLQDRIKEMAYIAGKHKRVGGGND